MREEDRQRRVIGRGAVSNPGGRFEANHLEAADDGWGSLDEPLSDPATVLLADRPRRAITRNTSPDVPFEQSVNPRQEFSGSVVGMKYHGYAIMFGHHVRVHGTGYSACNGSFFARIIKRFASKKQSAAIRKLNDNGRVDNFGRLQHGVNRIGAHHIYCRKRKMVVFCNTEDMLKIVTGNNPGACFT